MDYGTSPAGTPVSFATWQSSSGGDAHSQASNPGGNFTVANMFTSTTDLHLNTTGTNPALNVGTPLPSSVANDYDFEVRDVVNPDIGADEVPPVDLTVSKTHVGNFKQGETGKTYTITVSNIGTRASSGTVTVTDNLPAGLTATGWTGTNWNCSGAPA